MAANGSETLEVRLALVCYGGVSLAIYMSGITREIQELVTASALRLEPDAGAPSGTAAVYARLIEALETDAAAHGDPHRIQVGVDIVAGTSAGGINGICLARALDGDYSQEAIRNFWIEKADFGTLLDPKVEALLAKVRAESSLHGIAPQLDKLLGPAPAHPSWFARSAVGKWAHRVGAARRLKTPVIAFVKDPPAKRPPRGSHVLAYMGRPERHAEAHAACDGAVPLRRERDRPGGDVDRVRRALRRRPALARAGLRRGAPPRLPHPRSGRRIARPRRRDARVRRARDGVVPGRVRAGQPRSLPTADQGRGREGGLGRHRPPLPAPVPGRREGHRPPLRRRRRARQHAVRRGDRRHPAAQVPGRGAPRARVRRAVTHGRRLDPASRPPGPRRSRGQRRHGDVQERLDDPAVADDGRPDRQSAREERPRAGAPVGDRAAVRRRREAR